MILMKIQKGLTLVEILIVVAILLLLIVTAVGGINPIGIMNKARDAQRKKDLARIKIAFEEYFNDKGCYPDGDMVEQLMTKSNCDTTVFKPWLSSWLCDPNGTPYKVLIENYTDGYCPKWFKVLTNLENKEDKSIPEGWETKDSYYKLGKDATAATNNFGTSSNNISWTDYKADPTCALWGGCYYLPDPNLPNQCNSAGNGCSGANCYLGMCRDICKVSCCGVGCN